VPPLPLTTLLETALPRLSRSGRAVVGALGCFNGKPQSPSHVAALVGLRTRFQLARALRREGLPPFEELAAWTRVLYWLQEAERTGASLFHLAQHAGIDPAVAYRLVLRTTELHWVEARRAGLAAVVRRFKDRCYAGGQVASPTRPKAPPAPAARNELRDTGSPLEPRLSPSRHELPAHPRGEMTERLRLDGYPFDVAMGAHGEVWLSRVHAASVDCLTLEPLRVLCSVPTGAVPSRIAIARSGQYAYVSNQFASEVAVIDLQQRRQIGTIAVPGNPLGAVLSLDGQTLFVTTNLDCLHAIRLPTGQIIRSVPIPMACTSLLLHPGGTRLFVPTFRAGTILELETRTLKTLGSHGVGGVVHELACTPDGLRLYATNEDGWVDAIQLTTGRRDSLQCGTMVHGLALSPDGAVLYAGLLRAGAVAVVDRERLRHVATIHTGGKPRRIAFDITGRRAIVANEDGWVDLIT